MKRIFGPCVIGNTLIRNQTSARMTTAATRSVPRAVPHYPTPDRGVLMSPEPYIQIGDHVLTEAHSLLGNDRPGTKGSHPRCHRSPPGGDYPMGIVEAVIRALLYLC